MTMFCVYVHHDNVRFNVDHETTRWLHKVSGDNDAKCSQFTVPELTVQQLTLEDRAHTYSSEQELPGQVCFSTGGKSMVVILLLFI